MTLLFSCIVVFSPPFPNPDSLWWIERVKIALFYIHSLWPIPTTTLASLITGGDGGHLMQPPACSRILIKLFLQPPLGSSSRRFNCLLGSFTASCFNRASFQLQLCVAQESDPFTARCLPALAVKFGLGKFFWVSRDDRKGHVSPWRMNHSFAFSLLVVATLFLILFSFFLGYLWDCQMRFHQNYKGIQHELVAT